MSEQAMVKHIKRLDYLHVQMCRAKQEWIKDGSVLMWRRLQFCKKRYETALANPPKRRSRSEGER